ncbi:uncharacterized protein LOC112053499 isoform X2 [Bicyclus anynana]|uniref:Uncharacterized protein LOC112053499 isoform X2 n=1 Tax=Bicyclus anynana TaxID=110368 RepID=A0ABM3LVK6_BICAN|nr:uncharacterized protein LOC112053499 isoform X2 [Bicyclus anynana]
MADKKVFIFLILYFNFANAQSDSLLERSYEYVVNFSRNVAPSILSILDCFGENGDAWTCAREKAGKLFDSWDKEVQQQRMMWAEAADAEVVTSGRSFEELPSKLGREVELSLAAVTDLVENGMARALSRKKHHDSGGIDSITISTGGGEKKKKMKKKKQKPAKIHLIQPVMMPLKKMEDKGPKRVQSWVIGDSQGFKSDLEDYSSQMDNHNSKKGYRSDVEVAEKTVSNIVKHKGYSSDIEVPNRSGKDSLDSDDRKGVIGNRVRTGRGILTQMWDIGEKALDAVAEHAIDSENAENGLVDRSSIAEQRGKKKKKKKAILKLLILGAVLKAKIGTLLQILSFKLQVKFFIIALIGLGINLARFWVELKNKHNQQPQKEVEAELDENINSPYRAHQKKTQVYPTRPLLTLS